MSELLGLTEELVSGLEKVKRQVGNLEVQETGNTGSVVDPIINKQFEVWQRGTSFVLQSAAMTSPVYTADRWRAFHNGTNPTITVSRQALTLGQTELPDNPVYYLRWNQSVAGSGATSAYIDQCIEDIQALQGKTICIGFWTRCNLNNLSFTVSVIQHLGQGGSGSFTVSSSAFLSGLANAWKFNYVYLTVPSLTGQTIGTANPAIPATTIIRLNLPVNAAFVVELGNFQIDLGEYPRVFRRRSFNEELLLCYRFFQKTQPYSVAPGTNTGAGNGQNLFTASTNGANYFYTPRFNPYMRAVPTVTAYNEVAANNLVRNYTRGNDSGAISITNRQPTTAVFAFAAGAGWVAGDLLGVGWSADADIYTI